MSIKRIFTGLNIAGDFVECYGELFLENRLVTHVWAFRYLGDKYSAPEGTPRYLEGEEKMYERSFV